MNHLVYVNSSRRESPCICIFITKNTFLIQEYIESKFQCEHLNLKQSNASIQMICIIGIFIFLGGTNILLTS